MDPKGKNCVVTGAADGIGLSCTRELLRHGCQKVMMLDINQSRGDDNCKKLQQEFGKDKVMFVKCDVTKNNDIDNAMRNCQQQLKQIDLLVNCAQMLDEVNTEKIILCNLHGTIECTRQFMKIMGKDHGGRGGMVINMSSVMALQPMVSCPVYCATKMAILTFTRCMGLPQMLNRTGVKMMAMCAGVTENDTNYNKMKVMDENVKELQREMSQMPKQDTENMGQGMIQMMNRGENGSIWLCEGNQPIQEIHLPNKDQLKRQ